MKASTELMPEFYKDFREAGVQLDEYGGFSNNVAEEPHLLPVMLDWIKHYRSRLTKDAQFWLALTFQECAHWSGPQQELAEAMIAEYWALTKLDDDSTTSEEGFAQRIEGGAPQQRERKLKSHAEMLISCFSIGVSYAAASENHAAVRELILDPRTQIHAQILVDSYLRRSKSPDVPEILSRVLTFEVPTINRPRLLMLQVYAIRTASVRKFTELLPEVEAAAERFMALSDDEEYFEERRDVPESVYKLRRAHYAKEHQDTSTQELIKALQEPEETAFAAYTLGARKAHEALAELKPLVTSSDTRTRQEAKAAVKKLEK